jgi:hypothetical protein
LYDLIDYSESKDLTFCNRENAQRVANHATSSNSRIDFVHLGYALMNPNQTVNAALVNQTKQMNVNYRTPVNTSLSFWPHQYSKSRSVPACEIVQIRDLLVWSLANNL